MSRWLQLRLLIDRVRGPRPAAVLEVNGRPGRQRAVPDDR